MASLFVCLFIFSFVRSFFTFLAVRRWRREKWDGAESYSYQSECVTLIDVSLQSHSVQLLLHFGTFEWAIRPTALRWAQHWVQSEEEDDCRTKINTTVGYQKYHQTGGHC